MLTVKQSPAQFLTERDKAFADYVLRVIGDRFADQYTAAYDALEASRQKERTALADAIGHDEAHKMTRLSVQKQNDLSAVLGETDYAIATEGIALGKLEGFRLGVRAMMADGAPPVSVVLKALVDPVACGKLLQELGKGDVVPSLDDDHIEQLTRAAADQAAPAVAIRTKLAKCNGCGEEFLNGSGVGICDECQHPEDAILRG